MTLDGRLLLVAALEDAGLARDFAQRIGGDLQRARTSYGEREFVEGDPGLAADRERHAAGRGRRRRRLF